MDWDIPSDNMGKVAMVRSYRCGSHGLEVLHGAMIIDVDDPLPTLVLRLQFEHSARFGPVCFFTSPSRAYLAITFVML